MSRKIKLVFIVMLAILLAFSANVLLQDNEYYIYNPDETETVAFIIDPESEQIVAKLRSNPVWSELYFYSVSEK